MKPRILFCSVPLINNKYWSESLRQIGYNSQTLVNGYFSINNKSDFDRYIDDFTPKGSNWWLKIFPKADLKKYLAFEYAIVNFDVFHITLEGAILQGTPLEFWEGFIIKSSNAKIIINPYGADNYQYSQIHDPCVRHGLLLSYPENAKKEPAIKKKIFYWYKYVDCFKPNLAIDGLGKWDILPYNTLCIDTEKWSPKLEHNWADGRNGIVRIVHSANHRGCKGTEFICKAINELKSEGYKIEFTLIEGMPNELVRKIYFESDILVDQLIFCAYALSGIEGMASGLAVISNLSDEYYTRVFRRFSYLNECPVLSSTPETIKIDLEKLITNPEIRFQLAKAGRQYVEKYHSYSASQFMFENIIDKIWYGKDIDLLNLYNPHSPNSYNNKYPLISHPLFENKLR